MSGARSVVTIIGLLLILGPAIIALLDGVDIYDPTDESLIHWMMGKPLDKIALMQCCQISGLFFLTAAIGVP
jgi:hypothetical protein